MKNKPNFLKKINRIWITICLLLVVIFVVIIRNQHEDTDYLPMVCGGDQCFVVELARTPAEQQKGLMNREFLDQNNGMLFIFPKYGEYTFRMKNTLIPLDIIWIDNQFNVVKIMTAQPCTIEPCELYKPGVLARYVLEINAGMAEKHGITEGTQMKLINIQ